MSNTDKEVQKKLFEFGEHNIFGFIVPGAVLVTGICLHIKIFNKNAFNEGLSKFFSFIKFDEANWPSFISISIACLFCFYILGHVIALFSSALIDKLLVERTKGYPFQRLFNKTIPITWYAYRMKRFYKATILLFMPFIVCISLKGIGDLRVFWLLLPCSVMLGLKIFMSILSLRQIDDPYSFRDPNCLHRKIGDFLWIKVFWWLLLPFIWGFDFFSKTTLATLRLYKPFTEDFQRQFIEKFNRLFKLDPKKVDTEVHWLTYAYICKNSPESIVSLTRWLILYGFARNLSAVFIILFFYNIIFNDNNSPAFVLWNLLTYVGFLVFLLRYYYIYYSYYSKYLFRAFIIN